MKFRHPLNGYTQGVTQLGAFLGCLTFGVFYFAYKGVWKHFLISALAAMCTVGISWIVYPFFAYKCVVHSYLERGWKPVTKSKHRKAAPGLPAPSFDGLP